ncbi:hypothetical protein THASP1DRAFT_25236 [Thamnocephalis sphaerospora]|uniref:Uncharacterized protein n=1 Tax=Thamnocephalis sphaerospora TaxID=78915 RepID=A0A4P9XM55_9FUNG|nr:hypothetical protein THASP1DRAFT_25236 [Thamnocephalis sphaerospora]|eukprot:RKP06441.1 hypothetical protein THASP1DRAFT_25236 [Thamnocephalis sphaerospora]
MRATIISVFIASALAAAINSLPAAVKILQTSKNMDASTLQSTASEAAPWKTMMRERLLNAMFHAAAPAADKEMQENALKATIAVVNALAPVAEANLISLLNTATAPTPAPTAAQQDPDHEQHAETEAPVNAAPSTLSIAE